MTSAVAQIIRCYYHQHPEDYGRGYVDEPQVPGSLRYGNGDAPVGGLAPLAEELMGHPEARAG